jgi:hypothetical protein
MGLCVLAVVLEVFPDWLNKFFAKLKDANSNLTPISKEKKEINLMRKIDPKSSKAKSKKNNSEEIETFAPRDCDLGKFKSVKYL